MITLRNIEKSFGGQTLLEDAALQINLGDRFALIGPNGAGKSTLFRMILGTEEPDNGEIAVRDGVRIGYLPQETASLSGKTALEEALGDDTQDGRKEAAAKKILMGLGFRVPDFTRSSGEFSGGWQMRLMIARLLVEEPDLLMLDEPTNHLDLETLLWFQQYLRAYRGSLFLISHDRELINAVTTRIVEVGQGRLTVYHGSYEDYLDQKESERHALEAAYKRQQKEIADLERYITRFRAKASLAASVQSKIKYLERMERIELPADEKTIGFSFPQPERSGRVPLALSAITQSYDGVTPVYENLSLEIERGQKIALVGPNGAGKSTLLKLLAGAVPFEKGERRLGHNAEVGYFSQHRSDALQSDLTVFEEAASTHRPHSETAIRTLLGRFLFRGDAVQKTVSVLSGGEKSRLGLAKILLDPPNVLLMDEPTTHLDMASVEVLIAALRIFDGTLCFISHDVYFIRQIANHVIHVNGGRITHYPGDYDYFLQRKAAEDSEEGALFRAEGAIEAETRKPSRAAHAPGTPDGGPRTPQDTTEKPVPAETAESPASAQQDHSAPSGPKSKEQKRREAEERNTRHRERQEKKKRREAREKLEWEEEDILKLMGRPETHRDPKRVTELMIRLGQIRKTLGRSE